VETKGTERKTLLMMLESEELVKNDAAARKIGGKREVAGMTASEALNVVFEHLTVIKA
jgi:hypothetical protein